MGKLILSLDGGGIRGAATAQFLFRIEQTLQTDHNSSIRDYVDFYAGTSTGSIIALALATTNLTVKQISDLYSYQSAKEIFAENKGIFEIDGINAPKYTAKGKSKLLKANMGNAKLKDIPSNKHILAVTYAIEKRRPEVIKSTNPDHLELSSFKIADCSSAAPTYFPTRAIDIGGAGEEAWLVDGGVTANNPTMCALAEAKKVWNISIDDIRILSIGTGYQTRKINGPESKGWGAIGWMTKGNLIDVLTDERVVAYQARTISKQGNYIRVNAEMKPQPGMDLAPDDAMDDISRKNIKRLKEMGDFWYEKYGENVIQLLTDNYNGPSIDRIDSLTGEPMVVE